MPKKKESSVVVSGYMLDRGDLNKSDQKYLNILNLLDSIGISHILQSRVKILTDDCNELKRNASFEGENLRSRVRGCDILVNPETLTTLLKLPVVNAEDTWDEAALHQATIFMRYTGDSSKGLLKKFFPDEFKFLADILGKAFLCKPSAHNAISQDMLKAMAAVSMQRRLHWGKYLFHQIQTFFHNSHHGRILTIYLNKLDSATFSIDTGKPIHYTRIITRSLFDKWNIRIVPKGTQTSSSSHATPPSPLQKVSKKITINRPTKKSRQASSIIATNEPQSSPFSPSSESSQSSSSSEGFDRPRFSLTKPTPPPRYTILDIPPIPNSFQLPPNILPSSPIQVIDHSIHHIIPPSTSAANLSAIQPEAQDTSSNTVSLTRTEAAAETFDEQVDYTHYDIEEELSCQNLSASSFAPQQFDRDILKKILRKVVKEEMHVVKEEMQVVKEEMNTVHEMMSTINRESREHCQSIEQKISACVREISMINILFGNVQRLPEKMSSLEDKFTRLEKIVEYEVKRGENVNEETKCRVDQAMQDLHADIKCLKVIVQNKFDKEKLNSFVAPFDLEDTLSEANDRHPEAPNPSFLRAQSHAKQDYTFEQDAIIQSIIAESEDAVDPRKQACAIHHLHKQQQELAAPVVWRYVHRDPRPRSPLLRSPPKRPIMDPVRGKGKGTYVQKDYASTGRQLPPIRIREPSEGAQILAIVDGPLPVFAAPPPSSSGRRTIKEKSKLSINPTGIFLQLDASTEDGLVAHCRRCSIDLSDYYKKLDDHAIQLSWMRSFQGTKEPKRVIMYKSLKESLLKERIEWLCKLLVDYKTC